MKLLSIGLNFERNRIISLRKYDDYFLTEDINREIEEYGFGYEENRIIIIDIQAHKDNKHFLEYIDYIKQHNRLLRVKKLRNILKD